MAYLNDLTLGLPQVLMREIGGSAERYVYGQARLAQVNTLGVRTWAHADALGTPRLTHTTDGVIVDAPRTDAWGRPLHGTEPQPFGFTGELQDPTSDLVYLRARWYNPTSGTFLSRDPFAGFPNQPYSLHPYQYAYSSPLNYYDPTGHLSIFVMGGWNGVWQGMSPEIVQLAKHFGPLIAGRDILSSADSSVPSPFISDSHDLIAEEVAKVYHATCAQEPIVLVGYSRGASTVQRAVDILNSRYPEVTVNLVVLFGMVHAGNFTAANLNRSLPNVDRYLVFKSAQSNGAFPGDPTKGNVKGNYPDSIPGHPERDIQGENTIVVSGTDHFTLIDEFITPYYNMPAAKKTPIRNPAWVAFEEILNVVQWGPWPYNPKQ